MDISVFQFFLLSLASFRITRLLVYDAIAEKLRQPFFNQIEEDGEQYLVPKGFIGSLLSCHWCTGFWVSFIVVLLHLVIPQYTDFIFLVFAVAGLSSIIQWWVTSRD